MHLILANFWRFYQPKVFFYKSLDVNPMLILSIIQTVGFLHKVISPLACGLQLTADVLVVSN